jgi:hypothetical protein
MSSTICPSIEELRAFAVGDLSGERFERVVEHVSECDVCGDSLQSLDDYPDELVGQLASLRDPIDQTLTDVPHKLTVSVKSLVGLRAGSTDISVDAGRRLAKQLINGPCRLGKFDLLDELGIGSFGYVFRARDTELDRLVAVKIQRAGGLANDEEVDRFLREARSTAQLKHPHIVSLFETGQTDEGVCYLVTELVEGDTLEQSLARSKPTYRKAAEVAAQLAEALDYAHKHGVIHRDVKPSNIVFDQDHQPHIMDFGLAKRDTGELTMTPDGQVMGTPAYMSPVQARGDSHTVDVRGDVYSLGVVLYEMLTGERPFQGNRRMLMLQVLEDEPRSLRQLDEKIPRDLETVCLKAMSKSPARRYQTARDFSDDLRRYLIGDPIRARPEGYFERLWRWCRRYPMAVSLFLAVGLGSAVGIVYLSSLTEYFVRQTALGSARMEGV